MNTSIYILGNFGNGHEQYPIDYTQDIFKKICRESTKTQLITHRDNNLMYYTYIKSLKNQKYIGFCFLLNDSILTDINAVFDFFENIITNLSIRGELLKINEMGDVVENATSLLSKKQTLIQIEKFLYDIGALESIRKKLPIEVLSVSKNAQKVFDISRDSKDAILKATYTFGYTFINKDGDSEQLESYKNTLYQLNKEKNALVKVNNNLHEQVYKLTKQKKQQSLVNLCTFIIGILAACSVVFFMKFNKRNIELSNTQNSLTYAQNYLKIAEDKNSQLTTDYQSLKNALVKKEKDIISLKQLNDALILERDSLSSVIEQLIFDKENNSMIPSNGVAYTKISDVPLRQEKDASSKTIATIRKDEPIEILDHSNYYYKVRYKNMVGYIFETFLKNKR